MQKLGLLALTASLLLSACVDTMATETVTTIAPTAADRASPAYRSCVAAIARTTGQSTSDVSVFDIASSEAGTTVQATVSTAVAPWRCIASNDGTVQQVLFTGSEGSL